MKRTKEQQPSVAGLILVVTGLLLLSVLALNFLSSGNQTREGTTLTIGLVCASMLCLALGAMLSSRKRK